MNRQEKVEKELRDCESLLENPMVLYQSEFVHLIPHVKTNSLWNELCLYAKRRHLVRYYCSVEGEAELKKEIEELEEELLKVAEQA